ncbi:MAG: hypothetical protein ACKO4K_08530 [Flavobacteriales bacterium]
MTGSTTRRIMVKGKKKLNQGHGKKITSATTSAPGDTLGFALHSSQLEILKDVTGPIF